MYDIFTYIWLICMVNLAKYTSPMDPGHRYLNWKFALHNISVAPLRFWCFHSFFGCSVWKNTCKTVDSKKADGPSRLDVEPTLKNNVVSFLKTLHEKRCELLPTIDRIIPWMVGQNHNHVMQSHHIVTEAYLTYLIYIYTYEQRPKPLWHSMKSWVYRDPYIGLS